MYDKLFMLKTKILNWTGGNLTMDSKSLQPSNENQHNYNNFTIENLTTYYKSIGIINKILYFVILAMIEYNLIKDPEFYSYSAVVSVAYVLAGIWLAYVVWSFFEGIRITLFKRHFYMLKFKLSAVIHISVISIILIASLFVK